MRQARPAELAGMLRLRSSLLCSSCTQKGLQIWLHLYTCIDQSPARQLAAPSPSQHGGSASSPLRQLVSLFICSPPCK